MSTRRDPSPLPTQRDGGWSVRPPRRTEVKRWVVLAPSRQASPRRLVEAAHPEVRSA
jgi:hypothetical protein